ncbi:diguanylate cyclase [Clostridiaceae bacterium 35-E11]
MKNICINKKILGFLLLISLIPVTIMGYYGYRDVKQLLIEKEHANMLKMYQDMEGKFIKFCGNSKKDLFFLSQLTKKTILSSDDFQQEKVYIDILENAFYYFSSNNIQYDQIGLINQEGYEIIRINNKQGKPEVVHQGGLEYKGDLYYIQQGYQLKEGEIYVSPLDLNRENGTIEEPQEPMIRLVTPIYEDKNQLQGLLILNLKVSYLLRDIEKTARRMNDLNLMMIDEEGYYLLHSRKEKEWGGPADYNTGENFKKDFPNVANKVLRATSMQFINNGQDVLFCYPVQILKDMDTKFFVVTYLAREDYLGPLGLFQKRFFIELLFISLMIIAIGICISKYLSKPIVLLTKAVEDIGKGHFDVTVDIHTGDEIEALGNQIKEMAQELRYMYNNMEELVEKRTEELNEAHLKMEKMATTDPLTHLYNRHYFNQYMRKAKEKILQEKTILTVCMIDVDKFKYINDFYGHHVGDEVLKEVAQILSTTVRKTDSVIRYGGDEFLIVLPDSNYKDAEKLITRIKEEIKAWNEESNILEHDLSLSIGYAQYRGKGGIEEVIQRADERMYEEKNAKRQNENNIQKSG